METTKIKILLYNAENLFIVNEFLYKFTKITVMIEDLRKIYYNVFQHQKYELKIAKWRKKQLKLVVQNTVHFGVKLFQFVFAV